MAWYKPWTWGKAEAAEEAAQEEPDKSNEGDFSTDLTKYRQMKQGALNNWIHQNLFQKTAADIVPVNPDGVAMDSAIAMDSQQVKSAFSLSSSNLPQVLFAWYVQQGFIGYQACSTIAQQWLVNKACTVPAKDAIKNGYTLTVNDGSEIDSEIINAMRRADKRFKIKQNLVEFERMNRIFGIRIALFEVDSPDPDYYLKPFNLDGITKGSYKGISQVDPYWITPELDSDAAANPASKNFYEPTWWRISGKRYHRSHLIITRYAEVPDILKPSYIYGGLPLPQMIFERIYSAERTANEAPMLALTKRVNIVKTNTEKALGNQKHFEERMQAFNALRDNHGIFAIDKEEEYQQTDTALTDLDAAIMTQYQIVAAIANMPATKLLGTSPKGFNATGAYEQESYYDSLECIQEESYSPLLERHYQLLIRSEIAPKHNIQPFGFDVIWKPLDSPTAKELAEINEIKSRTDQNNINSGAIDAYEVRERLISEPDSGYNGLQLFEEPETIIESGMDGDDFKASNGMKEGDLVEFLSDKQTEKGPSSGKIVDVDGDKVVIAHSDDPVEVFFAQEIKVHSRNVNDDGKILWLLL